MSLLKSTAFFAALFAGLQGAGAQQLTATAVQPTAQIKWTDAGVPGVSVSPLSGDMMKGTSTFFLRYASGFTAPLHTHTPDHQGAIVSGTLVLIMDGKEQRLGPGSYFALKDKAKHAARCEGADACVMFIHAQGPWDAVMEK